MREGVGHLSACAVQQETQRPLGNGGLPSFSLGVPLPGHFPGLVRTAMALAGCWPPWAQAYQPCRWPCRGTHLSRPGLGVWPGAGTDVQLGGSSAEVSRGLAFRPEGCVGLPGTRVPAVRTQRHTVSPRPGRMRNVHLSAPGLSPTPMGCGRLWLWRPEQ